MGWKTEVARPPFAFSRLGNVKFPFNRKMFTRFHNAVAPPMNFAIYRYGHARGRRLPDHTDAVDATTPDGLTKGSA